MTEKTYSPYKLAIELGFTEAEARHYEELDLDATKLRQIARAKDMPSTKPKLGKPDAINEPEPLTEQAGREQAIADTKPLRVLNELAKHKHHYRKDGTCRCGRKRKAKK